LVKAETTPKGDINNYIQSTYTSKGQIKTRTIYIDSTTYTANYEYNERQFQLSGRVKIKIRY